MHSGNICIGGFMCSGKTSVGRELSRRLGWEFLDTDVVIEQRAGIPVPRIFAELGEPVFRRFEFEVVSEAVGGSNRIVSLGGGALVNEELRKRVLSNACLVILDVRAETVLCRAERQKGARPLLDSGTVHSLMAKRTSRLRVVPLPGGHGRVSRERRGRPDSGEHPPDAEAHRHGYDPSNRRNAVRSRMISSAFRTWGSSTCPSTSMKK